MALPSLRQLQYLIALYEHQHFGRAAQACNITQSTLSSSLKELESVLNAKLVERSPRVVVFTPAGVSVVRHAEELLLRARELTMLTRFDGSLLSGTLRMGLIPTVAPFLLPKLLPKLRRAHPDLDLVIHEEMSREGCAALAGGGRDVLILALPYDCGEFTYTPLFEDPIMVALAPDDPLARQRMIDPLDLPQERLLLLQEGHCLRDQALRACERPGLAPGAAPAASIHTMVQLVEARMGIALLPRMAIDAGVADGAKVEIRPLAGPHAHRTVAMAWRRSSARAEDFAVLAEAISEVSGWRGPRQPDVDVVERARAAV